MADGAFGKYSSILKYSGELPGWVPPNHKERVASYGLYTEIYWSHVATSYKIMNRGLDASDEPVYVPSSRIMVETINRYVAPRLTFSVVGATGTEQTQLDATQAFTDLFARERFGSRYAANKREGLIKGDWLWHIVADDTKPEGKRINLLTVKPENYFPVYEDETVLGGDPDKLVAVLLAELIQVGDEQQVRVQRYDRMDDGKIWSSLSTWKTDEWFKWRYDDEVKQPIAVLRPPTPLPDAVTAFPVYHVPNTVETDEVFGSSEMRGLEVLQAALNQSMTDEDLALALMGLGLYATEEAGSPMNDAGESVPWYVAPGAVLENAKGLRKVEGLSNLAPYTDHVNRLEGYVGDASGATDAARGRIEVAEAESGIALRLRLAPTLSRAEDKDQVILDVHTQMFYDLVNMWFPSFEGKNFTDVTVVPTIGDKLPVNRVEEANLVSGLVLSNILSAASARLYLERKGFAGMFDQREGDLVLAEKVATAAAEGGDAALEGRSGDELPEGDVTDAQE
jgi:hypothetical protein